MIAVSNKPDSVQGYHLSVPFVTKRNQAAYPSRPHRGRASHSPNKVYPDLCGISARKVYPQSILLMTVGSSYLPFSPLSTKGRRLFSVALSVSDKSEPGYSPVRRSELSGLSSLVSQRDSVLRHIKISRFE